MTAYDMIIHFKQLYEGQARHERYEISKALFQDDWVHEDSRTSEVSVGPRIGHRFDPAVASEQL